MERETGIEPATNSLEGCDSTTELLPPDLTRSSFPTSVLEEVPRCAQDLASRLPLRSRLPTGSTWKAVTLPLSYSRFLKPLAFTLTGTAKAGPYPNLLNSGADDQD